MFNGTPYVNYYDIGTGIATIVIVGDVNGDGVSGTAIHQFV